MTEIIPGRERRKAAFLEEYRRACIKHGMMVIQVSGDGYSPMSAAEMGDNPAALDNAIQEMLIEPLRTFECPPHE